MLVSRNTETVVTLDGYISDLNLEISQDRYSCQPMHKDGFAYMWAGAKATSGIRRGKVCYEVKIVENLQVTTSEFTDAHIVRVGWSTDAATLQLGEDKNSFGFGGTAKKSEGRKFSDYGRRFDAGDVIGCYLCMGGGWVDISYCVNGYQCGTAFKVRWNNDEALYPHILTKNCRLEVNFGQAHNPYFSILSGYKFIGNTPPEGRVPGAKAPLTKKECEIIMMVGLPGVGKTTWAMNYAKLHSNKKYNILGTDAIIDKMRVQGLPRKDNFGGRWDVLIKQATECFNVMLRKASNLYRNLILDQTNVYASARKRKARQYKDAGYRVNAMVLVPTDDEMISRSKHRTLTEGKEVPEAAINDMKANFSLPHENENLFTNITFLELQRADAENLVMQYNTDAGLKGYKSKKQSGYGDNENQKEKFEKQHFHEPPPQPPALLISPPNRLKGEMEEEWQRSDSFPTRGSEPAFNKNPYYGQTKRKEHVSPIRNTTYQELNERKESARNPESNHRWGYEDKDESLWWNKGDERSQYGVGNDNNLQYSGDNFQSVGPPPLSRKGIEQNNHNMRELNFNENREQPWRMERSDIIEPRKMSGNNQRMPTDNLSFPAHLRRPERSAPFAENDQRSMDDINTSLQHAKRNQRQQGCNFDDARRTMWIDGSPSQNAPPHQDMGDFRDDDRSQQWGSGPRHIDHEMHTNRREPDDHRMDYSDSVKPLADFQDWGDENASYGHKRPPDQNFRSQPPQRFRNDEDKFSRKLPERSDNNQRFPDYEFERKRFEPGDIVKNNFSHNSQGPMRSDSSHRQAPETLLGSLSSNLTGVDFDDLRATLANVRQQAIQGKNALSGFGEQVDPYQGNPMAIESQSQRLSHPIGNQPNSERYFRDTDQDLKMERQHERSGVEGFPRMQDSDSRVKAEPLLQHNTDSARRDPPDRYRNYHHDRNRGRPDEHSSTNTREDSKVASDKKTSDSNRSYTRDERRDAARGAAEPYPRRDRRRSPERSSQSRMSSSRPQRSSRDDYREDDSRKRKSSPRRYTEKRRSATKEKDDFGRDAKQRRFFRSPGRSQRDGKDGKSSAIDSISSRVTDSRERDRPSNRGSRRDARSPEKQHSEGRRLPPRSTTHDKRDRKTLLKTPGDSRGSPVPPLMAEKKFERTPRNEPQPPKVRNSQLVKEKVSDKKPLLATPPVKKVGKMPVRDRPDINVPRPRPHGTKLPQKEDKFDTHFGHDFGTPNQNISGDGLLGAHPRALNKMLHIPAEPFEEKPPSLLDMRPPLLDTPMHRFGDSRMALQRPPRQRFPRGNRPPPPLHEGMGMMPRMRPDFHPGGEGFPRPFHNADPLFMSMHGQGMIPGQNPRFPGPRHPMIRGPRPSIPGHGQRWRGPRMPRSGPPRPVRM